MVALILVAGVCKKCQSLEDKDFDFHVGSQSLEHFWLIKGAAYSLVSPLGRSLLCGAQSAGEVLTVLLYFGYSSYLLCRFLENQS